MKRIVFLIVIMALTWQTMAQRPLIMWGSPGYLYTPPATEDSVAFYMPTGSLMRGTVPDRFQGSACRSGHDVTVYGVAVLDKVIDKYPYRWVYMMMDRLVDSAGRSRCYAIDTVKAELYCFIEREAVSYADFGYVSGGDTHIMPFYEFYFTDPVYVPAGQRFYVGTSHSEHNEYNHVHKGDPYWPVFYLQEPTFTSRKRHPVFPPDSICPNGAGLDSTWNLDRKVWPGLVDWTCGVCTTPPEEDFVNGSVFSTRGYVPILHPPLDSTRLIPPHEHPLRAGGVNAFRLMSFDSTHATFRWDTLEPSDWGPVGVNANAYEVWCTEWGEEYDEADGVITRGDSCTVNREFDSTVMYKARCRARSYHACDIHDTMVWGEWSREVCFHTGVGVPDTVLECRRVEGLEYVGMVGGKPFFRWSRSAGHSRYEVEYAAEGGAWQRAGVTTTTEYNLRKPLTPGARYRVRVRAECDHRCHVHDTVLLGEWSDTVLFEMPTVGVDEAEDVSGEVVMVLTPNPAHGTVSVGATLPVGEYPAEVAVSDAKGREVMRRTMADGGPVTIDLGPLPAGVYLVTLTTRSHRTGTQRLVVE